MRFIHRMMATLGLVTVLSLIPFSFAAAYYKSPVDVDGDNYVRFGNADYPQFTENGLTLSIVEQSISHSWVDLNMTMWGGLVDQREIDKFLLLANGKIVEEFYPQLVDTDEGPKWTGWYQVKPSLMELIGSKVYFQVVAVQVQTHSNGVSQYAVAWSEPTKEISMDDLPVKDKEAISILYAILAKLKEMANTLAQMLKELEEQTRPSPQKLNELYTTLTTLMEKTPMWEMVDQLDQLNDHLEESRKNLAKPGSILVLGGQVDLLPLSPGGEVMFMDLTPYKDQIETFRMIMQASIWVFFFHMVFKWVTPKPEV